LFFVGNARRDHLGATWKASSSSRGSAKVTVTIDAAPETNADAYDPTGWNTARELIGFIKDGPNEPIGRDHDKYPYGDE
jgi:hypothetical protein